MAIGDKVFGVQTIAAAGVYDIRPSSGVEWTIHNIRYNNQLKLTMTDGTTLVDYDSDQGQGGRLGLTDNLTNGYFIRVTNTGASTMTLAFDGVQTK
jgi:hypothetical protein